METQSLIENLAAAGEEIQDRTHRLNAGAEVVVSRVNYEPAFVLDRRSRRSEGLLEDMSTTGDGGQTWRGRAPFLVDFLRKLWQILQMW